MNERWSGGKCEPHLPKVISIWSKYASTNEQNLNYLCIMWSVHNVKCSEVSCQSWYTSLISSPKWVEPFFWGEVGESFHLMEQNFCLIIIFLINLICFLTFELANHVIYSTLLYACAYLLLCCIFSFATALQPPTILFFPDFFLPFNVVWYFFNCNIRVLPNIE